MVQVSQKFKFSALIATASLFLGGCFDLGKSVEDDASVRSGSGFADTPATSSTPPTTPATPPPTVEDPPPGAGTPPPVVADPPPVVENSPPVISGTAPAGAMIGEEYLFTPAAVDADNDVLTFSATNLPPWAEIDPMTGSLSGVPMLGDSATYTGITISVSDGTMSDSLPAFNITVDQIGTRSVTLNWTPPTQNEDGSQLIDLIAYKVYYGTAQGNYPNEIRIDNPGISTYVVDNLAPNTYFFVSTSINASEIESDFSNVASKVVN